MSRFAKILVIAVAALYLAPMGDAWADGIEVNTTEDVVADDGRCSLREAVSAVNLELPSGAREGECPAGVADAVDSIVLPVGTFSLTRGTAGEDQNAGGDLDLGRSAVVVGAGADKTIIENGIGADDVRGDGDRLFHVDPAGVGRVEVGFFGVSLERGDVSCEGNLCAPGASAVEAAGGGRLTFQESAIRRNRSTCRGPACGTSGGSAAIRMQNGGAVTLVRSRVEKNVASCDGEGCNTGHAVLAMTADEDDKRGPLVIQESVIKKNTTRCATPACVAAELMYLVANDATITENSIQKNRSFCRADGCHADPILRLYFSGTANVNELVFRRNSSRCEGADCDTDQLIRIAGDGEVPSFTLTSSEVSKNVLECLGNDCDTDDAFAVSAADGTIEVQSTRFHKNTARCIGATCDSDDLAEFFAARGAVSFESAVFSRNRTTCKGFQCDTNTAVEVLTDTLTIVSTNLHRNTSRCRGHECKTDEAIELRGLLTAVVDSIEVVDNRTTCQGDLCATSAAMQFFSDDGVIGSSLFADNLSACDGVECVNEGGGALQNLRRLKVVDTSFLRNRGDGDGGAIHNSPFGILALDEVLIEDNSAGGRGGAIFNAFEAGEEGQDDRRGTIAVLRGAIRNNVAGESGGGIHNEGLVLFVRTSFEKNAPDDCSDGVNGVGCP